MDKYPPEIGRLTGSNPPDKPKINIVQSKAPLTSPRARGHNLAMEQDPTTHKNRLSATMPRAILCGVASTIPFWLWDPRHFSRYLILPLSFFTIVTTLSLFGLASRDPKQWIRNVFKSLLVFFGSTIIGVIAGLIFIRDTYGFIFGGLIGLAVGLIGPIVYWLTRYFQKNHTNGSTSAKP